MDRNFPGVEQLGEHIMLRHACGQLQIDDCDHSFRIVTSHQPSLEALIKWDAPQYRPHTTIEQGDKVCTSHSFT
jgi:hypothetical protein